MSQDTNPFFPWDIGVHDAHCHPTDTMSAITNIAQMKAATLTIMATRGQDQDLVQQTAESYPEQSQQEGKPQVIPCFGWHPWFSHQILIDTDEPVSAVDAQEKKESHYKAILAPSLENDTAFISRLPNPKLLSIFIAETRERLRLFPNALVGEIGLDRSFRLPTPWTPHELNSRDDTATPGSREGRRLSLYRVKMDHQRAVLKAQLRLAGEMGRAVSVHSVQAHGAVFELLKELWTGHERVVISRRERERLQDAEGAVSEDEDEEEDKKSEQTPAQEETPPLPFPPRICMHSYSGPVEPLRQFLHKANPSDVYFSFSSVINFNGGAPEERTCDVIRALPDDRVLIESDIHMAGPNMDRLLEEVARRICDLRGWELRQGVQQLSENWRRFVFG